MIIKQCPYLSCSVLLTLNSHKFAIKIMTSIFFGIYLSTHYCNLSHFSSLWFKSASVLQGFNWICVKFKGICHVHNNKQLVHLIPFFVLPLVFKFNLILFFTLLFPFFSFSCFSWLNQITLLCLQPGSCLSVLRQLGTTECGLGTRYP